MSSASNRNKKLSEEGGASTEEGCPFAATARESTVDSNVKVCELFHLGEVPCGELKSCPIPGIGVLKELVKT